MVATRERPLDLAQGFIIETYAGDTRTPLVCRYCDGWIERLTSEWYCEFEHEPVTADGEVTVDAVKDCECSWCIIRRDSHFRRVGRPPVTCGSDECRKAHNRDRARKSRAARRVAVTETH